MKFVILSIFFFLKPLLLIGNNLALPCYGCHKTYEEAKSSSIPSIEGIEKDYFISAFKEYKNKIRENYLMQIISQGYSESEIENSAEYFNNREISENDK